MTPFHRDARRPLARELYKQGQTIRAISRRFGVDPKTIRNDLAIKGVAITHGVDRGPRLPITVTCRIVELVEGEIERLAGQGATPPGRRSEQTTVNRVALADPPLRGAVTEVAMRAGCSTRQITRVRSREVKQMTLGFADRVITGLFGPGMWHTDPVLREWYCQDDVHHPERRALRHGPGKAKRPRLTLTGSAQASRQEGR